MNEEPIEDLHSMMIFSAKVWVICGGALPRWWRNLKVLGNLYLETLGEQVFVSSKHIKTIFARFDSPVIVWRI
jgi:hypothetical protein